MFSAAASLSRNRLRSVLPVLDAPLGAADGLAEGAGLAAGGVVCALTLVPRSVGPNTTPSSSPATRATIVTSDFRCIVYTPSYVDTHIEQPAAYPRSTIGPAIRLA